MRIAFLVSAAAAQDLVAGHARRLDARPEITATVLGDAAQGAGGAPWDLAVAVGWRAIEALPDLPAGRHVAFVTSMEDRDHPPGSPEGAAALRAYAGPVPVVAGARWIAEQLEALRGWRGAVPVVRRGLEDDAPVADVQPRRDGPLRVVVWGQADAPATGLDDAVAAVGAMHEPVAMTGPPAPDERAVALRDADVLLALPRAGELAGEPLEAFRWGATCVVTAVPGFDEAVVDGDNALLAAWDDTRGTARLLDLLARDRDRLAALRAGAVRTARAWPSAQESSDRLLEALRAAAVAPGVEAGA